MISKGCGRLAIDLGNGVLEADEYVSVTDSHHCSGLGSVCLLQKGPPNVGDIQGSDEETRWFLQHMPIICTITTAETYREDMLGGKS